MVYLVGLLTLAFNQPPPPIVSTATPTRHLTLTHTACLPLMKRSDQAGPETNLLQKEKKMLQREGSLRRTKEESRSPNLAEAEAQRAAESQGKETQRRKDVEE